MAEGAGVGRGAMGLQTLDASRGMSSPWGGFVFVGEWIDIAAG
jgi:hypothetical protein